MSKSEQEMDNLLKGQDSMPELEVDDESVRFYRSPRRCSVLYSIFVGIRALVRRVLGFGEERERFERLRQSSMTNESIHIDSNVDFAIDEVSSPTKDTGEQQASWFSLTFFLWFNSIVALGRKRPLFLSDLGHLLPSLQADQASIELERQWQNQQQEKKPSLFFALFYSFRKQVLIIALPRLWRVTSGVMSPWLLKSVIQIVENPKQFSLFYSISIVFILFLYFLISNLMFQHYSQLILKAEICVHSAVSNLIYKKLISLSAASKQSNIHGKLMNLVGSDLYRIMDMIWYGHFFWLTPALLIVCFVTATLFIGFYPSLAGFSTLIIAVPCSAAVAKKLEHIREEQAALTDARVKTTNEIFHAIKTVKCYALEEHLSKKADEARRIELVAIRRRQLWTALNESINDATIPIMSLVSILTFVLLGGNLIPSTAFSIIAIYSVLYWPFLMITSSLSATIEFLVSLKRIQSFLSLSEVPTIKQTTSIPKGELSIINGSFSWGQIDLNEDQEENQTKSSTTSTASSSTKTTRTRTSSTFSSPSLDGQNHSNFDDSDVVDSNFTFEQLDNRLLDDDSHQIQHENQLFDINFHSSSGRLTCIIGPVGSGKSSLLNTFLGELIQTSGTTLIHGSISYAPQTPFLLHATVRDNITFGCEYDEERYLKTIKACALQPDFEMLIAGDQTMIGERGINLSGGQKARISMARAVYSDSDICLLDDPLSAVDAHVGHKLFNDCIKGILKEKNVLLVTHQLQYVTHGDQLVIMQDGRITHCGTPEQVKASGVDLASLLQKFNEKLNNKQSNTKNLKESSNSINEMDYIEQMDDSLMNQNQSSSSLVDDHLGILSSSSSSSGDDKHSIPPSSSSSSSLPSLTDSFVDSDSLEDGIRLTSDQSIAASSKVNVTQDEQRGSGSIASAVYKFYFRHKMFWWLTAVVLILVHRAIDIGIQIYMGKWSSKNTPSAASNINNQTNSSFNHILHDASSPIPSPIPSLLLSSFDSLSFSLSSSFSSNNSSFALNDDTKHFLIFYSIGSLILVIFQILKSSLILIVCCWTGKVVYMEMFQRLIRAPMSFFDTTPKGRIASRCSKDTDAMDNRIGEPLSAVVSSFAVIAGSMIMIFMSVKWWILIMIPIMIAYYGIFNRIIGSFRDLTRMEGNAMAPLNTIFSESLNGLFTLRAFHRQPDFISQLYQKLDDCNRIMYHKYSCERWLSLRMNFLGTLVSTLFALIGIFNRSINPGLMAAALLSLIHNSEIVGDLIHSYTHVESYMNSVDRIRHYTEIESERDFHIPETCPPPHWPNHGQIEFKNVSFRYRDGLPLVLEDINLLIKPGEKIGVVGRTGAGKSSILAALLSLEPLASGNILIDQCDISQIGVGDLRSKLSIIPQDPVIFDGTIRHNLDPFHMFDDHQIWEILSRVHLSNVIEALPNRLDSILAEDGANFSLGQRQLICVGRALLKRSKILLLDEASSSIDLETDHLLQETLKTEFSDCTTVTIAHRLATIMDSDRVLVLEAGKIKEFDSPKTLLLNPNSLFYKLHKQTQSSAQKNEC